MSAYEYWKVRVQYTAGTWTDITADVDTVNSPIRSTNGSTPETTGEPASLTLTLRNVGFKYTPGNTSSAFALSSGMQIQFYSLILDQYVYHFTRFVESPEILDVNLYMAQDQTITLKATAASLTCTPIPGQKMTGQEAPGDQCVFSEKLSLALALIAAVKTGCLR